MSKMRRTRVRRSAVDWRSIMARFERTAQTGTQFCRSVSLPPNTFWFCRGRFVANKEVIGTTLWFLMCGRGTHEKVYGELKGGFGFDCVPTLRFEANSAW